jgi:Fe-S cluster biogenesis protein NfuA
MTEEELIVHIKHLIDERIRPAVQQDGGDIIFQSFKDGVVYVKMQGSCSSCPYAMITLKDGVERVIKEYVPEVVSVEAIKFSSKGICFVVFGDLKNSRTKCTLKFFKPLNSSHLSLITRFNLWIFKGICFSIFNSSQINLLVIFLIRDKVQNDLY